jgi:hypothetical protein
MSYLHYGREEHDRITRNYNAASVKSEIEYVKSRLREITANYKEYIAACKKQLETIAATEIKQFVYLKRRQNYGTKRIDLYVGVQKYPAIEGGEKLAWTPAGTAEKFPGTKRKAAREYAEKLAAQYGCEIREEGF